MTPLDAIALLRRLRRRESHAFWSHDRPIISLPDEILMRIQGYRQITDAMLLALAMQHGGQLATLDAGLRSLLPTDRRQPVYLIPV